MPSRPDTIRQSQKANELAVKGKKPEEIAISLGISPARVAEYLYPNSHDPSCEICHGKGIRDRISTGSKRPICARD